MIDTSRVDDRLSAARAFAWKNDLIVNLEYQLSYLECLLGYHYTRCVLFPVRNPLSFAFRIDIRQPDDTWTHLMDGTLLFRGLYDAQTRALAVTTKPILGWSIHTKGGSE